MADNQSTNLQVGGRMPFRYSLGKLYTEFAALIQKQQNRQLQFKVTADDILYWKWSDETSWKEVAELSDVSPAPATTIAGVTGLQEALDSKREAGVITVSDVQGLQDALTSLSLWASITDKPSTFPPSEHKHAIEDVTGLQQKLDSKQDSGNISVESVSGLSAELEELGHPQWSDINGKPQTFAPEAHQHPVSDVNGLQAKLDALATPDWSNVGNKPVSYPPAAHKHGIADVTGLQTALDGKRATGSIPTSDVTGLDDQLKKIGVAPAWADVTAKPDTFPPASHKHAIADVTGLETALAAIPKFETVTGKVVTAGTKVAIKFAKTYLSPPIVQPSAMWSGSQIVVGEASDITTTGCNVTVMQSRGTLLLTTGPFEAAAANSNFRMFVMGV